MRRYSREQEETIRAQDWVREWKCSGLLNPSQTARLDSDLSLDLRRTNTFLRVVLFLFTAVIVAASVSLVFVALDVHDELAGALILSVAALASYGCAEYTCGRFNVYRFGVEEAFATAAIVLLSLGAAIFASALHESPFHQLAFVGLAAAAISALAIYRRFGYLYAAVGSLLSATLLPTQTNLSGPMERLVMVAIMAVVFVVVRTKRLKYGDDFPGGEYVILQAVSYAGLYFVMNLQFSPNRVPQGWYYWATYFAIWILPPAGLTMSIREKDRALLDVSLAMALTTLATNKTYLRLQHHAWDPLIFGVFLLLTAIMLRRWLSKGPDGQRYGFTPVRLLNRDDRFIALAGTASATIPVGIHNPVLPDAQPKLTPGGGRSGGAGASGSF